MLTPWPSEPDAVQLSNEQAIARLGGVRVLRLPRLDLAEPERWGRLAL